MNTFGIIMGQIELFVVLILVGILAVKTKILNQEALGYFSKYLMRIAIPVMIFTNTIHGATRAELLSSIPVLLVAAVMFVGLSLLAWVMSGLLKLQGNERQIYRAASTFGNIGFMGIPLVAALFPETGMLYIALFTIVDQSTLWTLGMSLTQPAGAKKEKLSVPALLKKMINPAMVGILLSILFVLLDISLPEVVDKALTSIAGTSSPLSMIYIGGLFCYTDLAKYLKKKEFYIMTVTKMVLFPVVFYLILKQLPISREIIITITVLSALPEMSTIPMFADANGSDGEYAIGALMVTTMLSILTLPLIGYLVQML